MLARGIRSYHRPARMEEAQALAAEGVRPFAGGTRLFGTTQEIGNILDLSALGLSSLRVEESDLVIGSTATLQDVVDSAEAWTHSAGLLPLACRSSIPSRTLRHMATLGGEAVQGAPDSDIVAALLALNAIFVVASAQEEVESPAMRFLRRPADDLQGGGILRAIVLPGTPHGAALERATLLPSGPSLVSVVVAVTLADSRCIRARVAVTGLLGPPSRATEAEALLERMGGTDDSLASAAELVAERRAFRSDDLASAQIRKDLAQRLAERALRSALVTARNKATPSAPESRRSLPSRSLGALAYFTSGRIDITVDGRPARPEVDAGTTLLEALRSEGFLSVHEGCAAA
jgi:CO/xanthine dehydrogenase FAD-binding subunit